MQYQGMTALVTGASSGLGAEFAEQLAKCGANLVLVARSEDKLQRLAESLRERWSATVTVMPADLASAGAVEHLIAEVQQRGLTVDILVNNAGLGLFEDFLHTSLTRQLDQVDVNVRALVCLTHAFSADMVRAGRGGVINVASTAAFQPLAGASVYAATKAFVLLFSEGLSLEFKKAGVKVLAACPGPVATQFFANMKPKLAAKQMDQPAPIVAETLRAFAQGKTVVYPGKLINRLSTWGARFLPRAVILNLAAGSVLKLNQR